LAYRLRRSTAGFELATVRRYLLRGTEAPRGEYRGLWDERAIDRFQGRAHNCNCNRELVAASGAVNTAPAGCTAARERSTRLEDRLTSDCVPSIPTPERPEPPPAAQFFVRLLWDFVSSHGIARASEPASDGMNGKSKRDQKKQKGGWCKPPFYN
jgi:hypothetical protein